MDTGRIDLWPRLPHQTDVLEKRDLPGENGRGCFVRVTSGMSAPALASVQRPTYSEHVTARRLHEGQSPGSFSKQTHTNEFPVKI